MKLTKKFFYSVSFVILLLLQLYLPSFKLNVLLQLFFLGFYFMFEKPNISLKFLEITRPLFLLFLLGFVGSLAYHYNLLNVVKDIFHFLKPLIGILIGYFFFRKVNDSTYFIKSIVVAGILSALIHFVILVFFSDLASGSVSSIREFARDNFLELTALFFIIYSKHFTGCYIFKKRNKLYTIILTFSCVLYFSRTMLLVALAILFTIYGYTKITKKTLIFASRFLLVLGIFYVVLYSVRIERNKPGIEAFLYKIKIAPSELLQTKIDRENHIELWDHWRGYEAKRAFALMKSNPSSFVFGNGFGSLVNLKFKAPLTDSTKGMKFISEIHNGYVYVLYKFGFVGLLLYLYFVYGLYKEIYKKKSFETIFISAIGLVYVITTLTITGLFNNRDVLIFILGGLMAFHLKKKESA